MFNTALGANDHLWLLNFTKMLQNGPPCLPAGRQGKAGGRAGSVSSNITWGSDAFYVPRNE